MGKDIFGYDRDPTAKAVFTAEGSVLTIDGHSAKGALVQNWELNYKQDVQPIYEIGSSNMYWQRGRPSGSGRLGRLIGASDAGAKIGGGLFNPGGDAFNACKGGVKATISFGAGSCGGSGGTQNSGSKVTLSGLLVGQIGFSSTVQNVNVQENIDVQFASLETA